MVCAFIPKGIMVRVHSFPWSIPLFRVFRVALISKHKIGDFKQKTLISHNLGWQK